MTISSVSAANELANNSFSDNTSIKPGDVPQIIHTKANIDPTSKPNADDNADIKDDASSGEEIIYEGFASRIALAQKQEDKEHGQPADNYKRPIWNPFPRVKKVNNALKAGKQGECKDYDPHGGLYYW
ncbi:hypothetical protein K470DRAFT_286197 [Piedraia hortae CBS 480.64]|uniref:Uncharacterized protein n=1 Tax=Piedraia hortae CBS 480.64 TaxID=1314780 RepID=A0A6A7C0Y7_9PEZI|nr:hypothetical protein K470DRAFT_286197 [Piedraia hortae CBS 480.64]